MGAPLSEDMCRRVVVLHREGNNAKAIGHQLLIDPRTAQSIIKRYQEGTPLQARGQKDLPRKRTRAAGDEEEALLVRLLQEDDTLYLSKLTDLLEEAFGEPYTVSAVWRSLKACAFGRVGKHAKP